ncbi:hypothetical protein BBK36DRAFT_8971 [Trichoderma citrinoviride]|uniref:Gag1-like clamp domain-containing protein n=1 Tax=Trichoderma citrinoviride TaxID=58853 RepID=A0A2T4AXI0_9HYPO|nr:hypothetical protein BBK36DRAFT_8971 [Trichoderma citrinoviride]PTB61782.1 hypothetical protein BBK36DRAFT_8971 [Trichoderma citrinoviride]
MSSQPPPPGVTASLATASSSASPSASASSSPDAPTTASASSVSASASASASLASPASPRQLSSSPHSSTASTSDTITYATYYSASSSSAAAATYSHDQQLRLLSLPSHDAIDPTAAISLGHRHLSSSLEDTINASLPAFSVPEAISLAADPDTAMIFSDFYKRARSPLSRLRSQNSQSQHPSTNPPPWLSAEYEDLLSKDKYRQKDAIKRYLAAKVKTSWDFQWSPSRKSEKKPAEKSSGTHEQKDASVQDAEPEAIRVDSAKDMRDEANQDVEIAASSTDLSEGPSDHEDIDDDNDDDTDSVYSVISEDPVHYRPRMDWYSDLSDDEAAITSLDKLQATDTATRISILEKRALRRRAARDEMTWNEGLACFEARRNAWTGAKTVRVRSKPVLSPPVSPRSPRRFFFRRSISGSPPSPTLINSTSLGDSQSGGVSDSSSIARDDRDLKAQSSRDSDPIADHLLPVQTLLPIPHPILPPNNSFRASITPSIYLSLYDKVILNNLQPSCPINLADMIRACVTGWKRDGEWPPKPSAPEPIVVTMRRKKAKKAAAANGGSISMTARRLSFGLLGREKEDELHAGTGIRKSIQKVLGLGPQPDGSHH